MRERPNNEQCNLCGEWHKEGIENYVEHLKNCDRKKVNVAEDDIIDRYSSRGNPYADSFRIRGIVGVKQSFAVYIKKYAQTQYFHGKIIQFTRIGAIVSLSSFYDMGRIPLTFGGNGRVMWVGQKGSKWLNFHTWAFFRWKVLDRDNGKCKRCGKVVAEKYTEGEYAGLWKNDAVFVCDHIIPLCLDGKDWWQDPEMSNFQTLCEDCNKIKTKADMGNLAKNQQLTKAIGNGGLLTSYC